MYWLSLVSVIALLMMWIFPPSHWNGSKPRVDIDEGDFELKAAELRAKYINSKDREHPVFTKKGWRAEVNRRGLLQGYWEWVETMIFVYDNLP